MEANSSPVKSSQQSVHSGLEARVKRSQAACWRRPFASHSLSAFESVSHWIDERGNASLILDSGCGVGVSTRYLAAKYPDHSVIGVDRSHDRLSRQHGKLPDNAFLVRADLVDFWRLAHQAEWHLAHHFLLYPNPYPKPGLLKHRWQGHPVLPDLLALGGKLELRSNWELYVREFTVALEMLTRITPEVEQFTPALPYLTPFEQKYHQSGHSLWRLYADLTAWSELAC